MPSAFDLKDAEGNLLLSVDNATFDDEYDSLDSSDFSTNGEDHSDPEEQSNSNKKR